MRAAILAIEDNPDNMELFAWILEDEGYAFEGVDSAEEGLATLERESFDLVLMDIALPGIDGKEATRRIRATPRLAHLPVIAVTAHASKSETEEIVAAGVTSVVTKPLEQARLIQAIRSGLLAGRLHASKVLVVDDVPDNVELRLRTGRQRVRGPEGLRRD